MSPQSDAFSSSNSTICSISVDVSEQGMESPQNSSSLRSTASCSEENKAVAPQLAFNDGQSFTSMASPWSDVSSVSPSSNAAKMGILKSFAVTKQLSIPRLSKVKTFLSLHESVLANQRPPNIGSFSDSDSSEDNDEKRRRQRKASTHFSVHDVEFLQQKVMDQLGIELDRPQGSPSEGWFIHIQRSLGILHARFYIAFKKQRVKLEPPTYPVARNIADSLRFETLVAVLIVINAAVIGCGTMLKDREQQQLAIEVFEHIFTLVFLIEFILRIMAYSWVWIFEPMNMFDTFIVWIPGVLVTWILVPLGSDVKMIHLMKVLRILRIARILRVVRLNPFFHELWMLVSGVIGCMQLLFWAIIIMGAVHFMFAVASIEMVAKSDKFEHDELVQSYLGSIPPAMFTLFQLMTFSSWARLISPILFEAPEMSILFFLWIGFAGIVLRNLLTAIMVNNAFEDIDKDKEAQSLLKQCRDIKTEKELRKIFDDLDEDRNGFITSDEFTDVLGLESFLKKIKMLDIDLDELPVIFAIIDDGDGYVTIDEFCEGLTRMQGVASSRDMLKAKYKARRLKDEFSNIEKACSDFAGRGLDKIEESLERSHEHFLEMHMLTANILKNLNTLGVRKILQASTRDLPALEEPTSNELAGAASTAASSPSRLDYIPPTWVAHRREQVRKWQGTERHLMPEREPLREGLCESKEPKNLAVPAGEWDNLQVSHNILQSSGRRAKSSNNLANSKPIVLPNALVQRVTLGESTTAQKPQSAPEHKRLSLM